MWEGKRVSNALYALYNMSLESNFTSHLAHEPNARFFYWPWNVEVGIFCDSNDTFCSNAHSISCSFGLFAWYHAFVSLHSKPHPQINTWIAHSHWSVFEFLACDFPKTSCPECTNFAFDTLFSSLLYTLDDIGAYLNIHDHYDPSNDWHVSTTALCAMYDHAVHSFFTTITQVYTDVCVRLFDRNMIYFFCDETGTVTNFYASDVYVS